MKVVFTGGGTGGHFFPIIAVAEELNDQIEKQHIAEAKLYYFADDPYDERLLFENGIEFRQISAGKLRIYPSLKNFTDLFVTLQGIFQAIFKLFAVYPDVVFAKGGYSSFPTLFAARLMRIPVIIHESDSAPGRVNKWASKFAKRIAISYKEAIDYFPKDKTALTGQPVRKTVMHPTTNGAKEFLALAENIPTILVLGGSQGATLINETIINALPRLIDKYQIIHQTGKEHIKGVEENTTLSIGKSEYRNRYKPFGFLNPLALSMSAALADVVITRAGSTLFEVASWGIPSIVIPFTASNADHARKNAFNYARVGAGLVIEEKNLGPELLLSELERITTDKTAHNEMSKAAKEFFDPHAAERIVEEIVAIGLSHEK
jgi:UDP-N-acetylglucosamine--N-acetylmuramyl-(pentapeptide) pyrophosphoryl-undecaprenol N-acetylglucosamine transferase